MSQKSSKVVLVKGRWHIKMKVLNAVVPFIEYQIWHQCEDDNGWWSHCHRYPPSTKVWMCSKCAALVPIDIVEIRQDLAHLQRIADG